MNRPGLRILKDLLGIVFGALAELFDRLAMACEDHNILLPPQAVAEVTPNGHVHVTENEEQPQ